MKKKNRAATGQPTMIRIMVVILHRSCIPAEKDASSITTR